MNDLIAKAGDHPLAQYAKEGVDFALPFLKLYGPFAEVYDLVFNPLEKVAAVYLLFSSLQKTVSSGLSGDQKAFKAELWNTGLAVANIGEIFLKNRVAIIIGLADAIGRNLKKPQQEGDPLSAMKATKLSTDVLMKMDVIKSKLPKKFLQVAICTTTAFKSYSKREKPLKVIGGLGMAGVHSYQIFKAKPFPVQ